MSEYQLQIKQVVDYPRCRIYRQFVQSLIKDQNIRAGGGSGLFHFVTAQQPGGLTVSFSDDCFDMHRSHPDPRVPVLTALYPTSVYPVAL